MKLPRDVADKVLAAAGPKKPGKYGSVKVTTEDGVFDSKKEHRAWLDLKVLAAGGKITQLRRQVRLPLVVNGARVGAYVADFTYVQNGRLVVADVKSEFTKKLPVYRLKKKLVRAIWGYEIKEL